MALMSHGVFHYLWSADLFKSFSQLILSILTFLNQYLSFLNILFNRFYPMEKCGIIPHCLHRDSLTLTAFNCIK